MKDKLDRAELRLVEKKIDEKINSNVLEQNEQFQKIKSEIAKIDAEKEEIKTEMNQMKKKIDPIVKVLTRG